jgi:hypothetical protein
MKTKQALNESTPVTDGAGTTLWRNEAGQLHRTAGPSVECANGDKCWYLDGQLHRADGPAVEYANGSKWWYQHGEVHRVDGPAIEYANGGKLWNLNGQLYCRDPKRMGDSLVAPPRSHSL